MSAVSKYRMLVQARTDLTPEEIRRYEASKGPNAKSPSDWPYRDTGEMIHARRSQQACLFYRALRQVKLPIKIRAVKVNEPKLEKRNDTEALRAWRGFECVSGSVVGIGGSEAQDEVKHFSVASGTTACGIRFDTFWTAAGKPECDKCLAVAINCHPEMRKYL